nr:ATP-binding protein [Microbacterium bovistercoris]
MSPASPRAVADRDRREDLRVLLLTAGALLTTFAIGSTVQAVFVFRPLRLSAAQLAAQDALLPTRLLIGLVTVGFVLLVCALVRLPERRLGAVVALLVGTAVIAGVGRHLVQLWIGVYAQPSVNAGVTEIASVFVVVIVSILLALLQVRARVRLREHERAAAEQRTRASVALAELAAEEMRVRREVAEGLHGTLQGRLVLTQTALGGLIDHGRDEGWDAAALDRLDGIRRDLDTMREHDVRELSQLVYPVGVDVSLAHAVRSLVRRVPADIAVTAQVAPEADHALDGDHADAVSARIALVRAVEEGITNALRHGAASGIDILIRLDGTPGAERVILTVDDDGAGLPALPRWNGLARLAERLERNGGRAALEASPRGGARLRVELPAAGR